MSVIDTNKISEELLEILVKNEVPIDSIDIVFNSTKRLAHKRSIVQNQK